MPDPWLFLKALSGAALASMLIVLASVLVGRRLGLMRQNWVAVLASAVGLIVGEVVLGLRLDWPPANGLDRLLQIVVPAVLIVELFSAFSSVPHWCAWVLRLSLAGAIPRILLHASVYLSRSGGEQPGLKSAADLVGYSALLAGTWFLLWWLSQRSPGVSIPLALAMAIQCAGLSIMLAGYVKGGSAAFPISAMLLGTTLAACLLTKLPAISPLIGIGTVGLFGLLFIGHFFGRLSSSSALAMLLAPLLCWVSELSPLRNRRPWLVGSIRLLIVAIPLVAVLVLAKRDFDRTMAPLLGVDDQSGVSFCSGIPCCSRPMSPSYFMLDL